LKELDVISQQGVFIDDRKENIETSKQLGIQSILFKHVELVWQDLIDLGLKAG